MTDSVSTQADLKLEEALAASGARDPREFYRERLRELKDTNPAGYGEAVAYYRETLLPAVAGGSRKPLAAWTEYGRVLAQSLAPGRTVSIDESGRAHPYEGNSAEGLVLHLPDDQGRRALLVGLPPGLTDAQRATYDVLVSGKQRTRDGAGLGS
ncbi:MAG: hypothetical protein O2958_01015 [Gemmatimonadetes bacterium]|nr:hypothetical protein [Gemmatimonadota bacterium]MDA1102621.1 hypothetical protein [Gemmatimonadota bacterium]